MPSRVIGSTSPAASPTSSHPVRRDRAVRSRPLPVGIGHELRLELRRCCQAEPLNPRCGLATERCRCARTVRLPTDADSQVIGPRERPQIPGWIGRELRRQSRRWSRRARRTRWRVTVGRGGTPSPDAAAPGCWRHQHNHCRRDVPRPAEGDGECAVALPLDRLDPLGLHLGAGIDGSGQKSGIEGGSAGHDRDDRHGRQASPAHRQVAAGAGRIGRISPTRSGPRAGGGGRVRRRLRRGLAR